MGDGATFPTIPDDSTNSNDATLLNMVVIESAIRANAPNSEAATYFSYELGNVRICLGSSSERLYCHLADTTASPTTNEWHARYIWDGDTSVYHIATMQVESSTDNLKLQYNDGTPMEAAMTNYDNTQTYDQTTFSVGNGTHLGYLDGNFAELIVFNYALTDGQIAEIQSYLNTKYQIY